MTQVAQDETTSDDGVLARERSERADRIIRTHTLWGMGAGLIPVPMFDVLAVSAIQIDMLKQLAEAYDSDFTENLGKTFVTALTGGTFARFGASLIKAVPGVGTLVGGASMSVLSGASTYAVGQVAKRHYETGGNLIDIDLDSARKTYDEALESGKRVVGDLKNREAESKDVYSSLERLSDLKQKGVITEEEFEAKKREMLERL
ncbi:MAG: DUF697 domain-containing protein [Dehalococcoidia bacterium]|nr:DUF697 domain-containing protein [Dehalococcoidia bacterium]